MIQITNPASILGGRSWRGHPSRIAEIEELRHVDLSGIALGKGRHTEAGFNELKNRRCIGHAVRHKIFLGIWRDDDQGHAIPGIHKVAKRPGSYGAGIAGK